MPVSYSYNQCVFQNYILTVIQIRADSVGKEVLDPTRSQVFHIIPMGELEKLSTKQSQYSVKRVGQAQIVLCSTTCDSNCLHVSVVGLFINCVILFDLNS